MIFDINKGFDRIKNEAIGEECLLKTVNGLPLIIVPKPDFKTKHANFAVHYGSVNKDFIFEGKKHTTPLGTAHYLEHKMFSKPYGDSFEKFAVTGATANAYTSFNHTGYVFTGVDSFYDSLRILLETVTTPYFTDDTVKSEFGIIKQEIDMLHDSPANRCYYNLLECLFTHHPIRFEIAGTEQTIRDITPQTLYLCHKAFYNPANSVLCCCGNIDAAEIENIVKEYIKPDSESTAVTVIPDEDYRINKPYIREKMSVSMPLFAFGIKDAPQELHGAELVKHSLACEIISDVISSRSGQFFLDLYNRGLINSSFDSDVMREHDFGVFAFSGESDYPDQVIEEIIKELSALKKRGISSAEFRRAKNNNYGYFLSSFDNCENLAAEYVYTHFDGLTPFDTMHIYESLTIDYINSKLDLFDTEKSAFSIIDKEG